MSTITTEQMRYAIKRAYPGKYWADKVAGMPDYQVLAVYHAMKKAEEKKPDFIKANPNLDGHAPTQLIIDDPILHNFLSKKFHIPEQVVTNCVCRYCGCKFEGVHVKCPHCNSEDLKIVSFLLKGEF